MRALQLDEELAEAHTSLAFIAWTACAWNDAGRSFRRAIELSPGYATAHHWHSLYLKDLGRMDEAVAEIRTAEELDPLSLVISADVALVLFFSRRYDEAIQQSARTLELDPTFALAHYYQGFAYERKGMYADALRAYERMGSGDSPGPLAEIGIAHALSGNRREALRILRRLEKLSTERYVRPDQLLRLYAALGDTDKVVTALEASITERGKCIAAPMLFDPRFDETRTEPRSPPSFATLDRMRAWDDDPPQPARPDELTPVAPPLAFRGKRRPRPPSSCSCAS